MCRLKLPGSSARCHSRRSIPTFGSARLIEIWSFVRGNDVARRLMTIPGIGPVGATALAASVTDPHLPVRAAVCCLAGTDATSEVERWQRKARPYHQDGRQVSAQVQLRTKRPRPKFCCRAQQETCIEPASALTVEMFRAHILTLSKNDDRDGNVGTAEKSAADACGHSGASAPIGGHVSAASGQGGAPVRGEPVAHPVRSEGGGPDRGSEAACALRRGPDRSGVSQ